MTVMITNIVEKGHHLKAAKAMVEIIQASKPGDKIAMIKMVKEALDTAHDAGVDKGFEASHESVIINGVTYVPEVTP